MTANGVRDKLSGDLVSYTNNEVSERAFHNKHIRADQELECILLGTLLGVLKRDTMNKSFSVFHLQYPGCCCCRVKRENPRTTTTNTRTNLLYI